MEGATQRGCHVVLLPRFQCVEVVRNAFVYGRFERGGIGWMLFEYWRVVQAEEGDCKA